MKTWMVRIDEEEMKALIYYHSRKHFEQSDPYFDANGVKVSVDRSARIHDLTKRLNKDFDLSNDPRPNETAEAQNENQQAAATNQTGAW